MKRLFAAIVFTALCTVAGAQSIEGVNVERLDFSRQGDYMLVDMTLDMSGLDVNSNRVVLITPYIVNGADSTALKSIGVYGRRRYFYYLRNGLGNVTGSEELSFRNSENPGKLAYTVHVPFVEWMNNSSLKLYRTTCGCCNSPVSQQNAVIANFVGETPAPVFFPTLVYTTPVPESVKSRSIQGTAYVDFVVDKTDIRPEYHNNFVELGKIRATIDSVRNDSDITITNIWLKGYASPESPYSHNRDLAIGRTEAVKRYVQSYYKFDSSIISTDYEPENWEGLRAFVDASNLEHRSQILDIIDGTLEPDPKEWKLKSTYPEEYRFLLQNCYPWLRRTDYRVAYTISDYKDIAEIRKTFDRRPKNLSLNEFYMLAQEYEPGTQEFSDVFETAVRIYPDDEVANLNAANAAMRIGNNAAAEKYLAKAGDSAQAVYARGTYAYRTGNYAEAAKFMTQADKMGIAEAAEVLAAIEKINNTK